MRKENEVLKSILDHQCEQGVEWFNNQTDAFKKAYETVEGLKSKERSIKPSIIDGKKIYSKDQIDELIKISDQIDFFTNEFNYDF